MVSISFIIPIYNVEQYVQRCLESIMAQDGAEADMECLIIDDCGADNSMQIVRKMIAKYHGPIRFEIIQHDVNRGLSAARNSGIKKAKGEYVFFVDSDDYLKPDSISYFLENLKKYPYVDMVIGNVINCKDGSVMLHHICEPWLINDSTIYFQRMLRHQIYLYAWNKLIRRSLLVDNSLFFIDGILYEDQSWSYLLFSNITSVLLLPRVTYVYEFNMCSIVNTTFTSDKAGIVIRSYTVNTNMILKNPPNAAKYQKNVAVDYLLFVHYFLMNGVDVQSRFRIANNLSMNFRKVKCELVRRSVVYGRVFLACFFFTLFPPLSYLQRFRLFRCHYYRIDAAMNRFCHLLDFMHNKNRL